MNNKYNSILIYFFLVVASVIIIRNAWAGDDAYIAFRTVFNFVHGYGLTFNINERVQSFTNPLWVLVLSFFYFFTGEVYFTCIFLSLALTVFSLYIISSKLCKEPLRIIIVFILALSSKAFIDYSTSGLENALSYLLLALFFYVYLTKPSSDKKILILSFIASLGAVNRLDNILLYFFPMLFEVIKSFSFKTVGRIIVGFTPIILWELFAVIYYGFPFPNTYYAKLNTGIPANEYIDQGLNYMANSFSLDPITLPCIAITLLIAGWQVVSLKKYNLVPLALSIILYLIYTVKVGGDFMSGRFLTYPFLITLILIPEFELPKGVQYFTIAACLAIGIFSAYSPITTAADYREDEKWNFKTLVSYGISDERAWYYPHTGLLNLHRHRDYLPRRLTAVLLEQRLNKAKKLGKITRFKETEIQLGFNTYEAGPDVYFFHHMGLSDVLITRLPIDCLNEGAWRIGHIWRRIPEGYVETLETDQNKIKNKYIAEYYDKINTIIRGKLFSWDRFKTIYEMNVGKYNYLIDSSFIGKYSPTQLTASENTVVTDNSAYFGVARCVDSTTKLTNELISHGPCIPLKKGAYKINFSIRIDDNKDSQEVVEIDVCDIGGILVQKTLKANDFKEPLRYQVFTLNIAPETDLRSAEFRISYKGRHNICTDYIEIIPQNNN